MVSSSHRSSAKSQRTLLSMAVLGIKSIFCRSEDFEVFPPSVERMSSMLTKIFLALMISALIAAPRAEAGSIGDFLKALGNSIAHPSQKKKAAPPPKPPTKQSSKIKGNAQNPDYPPTPAPTMPTPTPSAATTSPPVRSASVPPVKNSKLDIPYGIPVPGKPGFVTSPFAPKAGYVDVRGFPSGTEVKDPYSGKI